MLTSFVNASSLCNENNFRLCCMFAPVGKFPPSVFDFRSPVKQKQLQHYVK